MQVDDIISKDELPPSPKRIKLEEKEAVDAVTISAQTTTNALNQPSTVLSPLSPSSSDGDKQDASSKSNDAVSEDEAALAMLSMLAAPQEEDAASETAAISLSTALVPTVVATATTFAVSSPPRALPAPTTPSSVKKEKPEKSEKHEKHHDKSEKADKAAKASKPKKLKKKRARESGEGTKDSATSAEKLYCICRKPYVDGVFMIACDKCDDWFHGECVNISSKDAKKMSSYTCALCEQKIREEEARKEQLRLEEERRQQLLLQQQALQNQRVRVPKTDQPCQFRECGDYAREGSRYCSHECGVRYALIGVEKEKLEEAATRKRNEELSRRTKFETAQQAMTRQREMGQSLTILEQHDLLILQEIQREIQKIHEKRATLNQQRLLLQAAIEKARTAPPLQETNQNTVEAQSETTGKKAVARFATLDVVDCVSCGQPVHHSKLSKHLESCYLKVENTHAVVAKELTYDEDGTSIVCCDVFDPRTKTYCKKLKASCPLHSEHFAPLKNKKAAANASSERCGCPTNDFSTGICELTREDCDKHSNWENLRAGELLLEDISLTQALNAFLYDERVVIDRIILRRELQAKLVDAPTIPFGVIPVLGSPISAGR